MQSKVNESNVVFEDFHVVQLPQLLNKTGMIVDDSWMERDDDE